MSDLTFSPLFDAPTLTGMMAIAALICLYMVFRMPLAGLLRLACMAVFLLFFLQPRLVEETTTGLPNIVLLIIDESGSQQLDQRDVVTQEAVAVLTDRLTRLNNTEIRTITVTSQVETDLGAALRQGLADIPRAQLAGIFMITDGQTQGELAQGDLLRDGASTAQTLGISAPVHVFLTGHENEKDRVLEIINTPRFGIINEVAKITFRVKDTGIDARLTTVNLKINGRDIITQPVRIGEEFTLNAPLTQPGKTVLELTAATAEGELTTRNNTALIQISVIRDRLRVLLVSGEPHAGERVWRSLLKSDPAVDLIHFTILKPSTKALVASQEDLALIRFPENELFLDKLTQFDVLIFDRYTYRNVLNPLHFNRMSEYVQKGGAILIASGPEFTGRTSIAQQRNLAYILPALPNGETYTKSFVPTRSKDGRRHPITDTLGVEADWGRWLRSIGVTQRRGRVLLQGANETPLLIVDRVKQGRVALLLSDHVWLWARQFDGGGPHRELLRRLVHWLMKEPELEEDALRISANVDTGQIILSRRSLADEILPVLITGPDGRETEITLSPINSNGNPDGNSNKGNGKWQGQIAVTEPGLYTATTYGEEGQTLFDITAFGLATPTEFQNVLTTGELLAPLTQATGGRIYNIRKDQAAHVPSIRQVSPGRPLSGRGNDNGWAAILKRNAEQVDDITSRPLIATPLWLLILALLLIATWVLEGWKSLLQSRRR